MTRPMCGVSANKIVIVIATLAIPLLGCGKSSTPVSPTPSGPPLLVVAFGDSLTLGVGATQPYPAHLQSLLIPAYSKGPVEVQNAGRAGELASAGVSRLPGILSRSPRFVVIMEGVNDLNAQVNNPNDPNDVNTAAAALTQMVRQAKAANAQVLLATVPPQRPGWMLLTGRVARSPELLNTLNDRIRAIASAEGVTLVDVHGSFGGTLDLISSDGLHPTPAGYDLISQTIYNALRPLVAAL